MLGPKARIYLCILIKKEGSWFFAHQIPASSWEIAGVQPHHILSISDMQWFFRVWTSVNSEQNQQWLPNFCHHFSTVQMESYQQSVNGHILLQNSATVSESILQFSNLEILFHYLIDVSSGCCFIWNCTSYTSNQIMATEYQYIPRCFLRTEMNEASVTRGQ